MERYVALLLSQQWFSGLGFAGWGAVIGKGWTEPRLFVWCRAVALPNWKDWWETAYYLDGEIDDGWEADILGDSTTTTRFGDTHNITLALKRYSAQEFREEFGLSKRQVRKLLDVQAPAGGKLSESQVEALKELLAIPVEA